MGYPYIHTNIYTKIHTDKDTKHIEHTHTHTHTYIRTYIIIKTGLSRKGWSAGGYTSNTKQPVGIRSDCAKYWSPEFAVTHFAFSQMVSASDPSVRACAWSMACKKSIIAQFVNPVNQP